MCRVEILWRSSDSDMRLKLTLAIAFGLLFCSLAMLEFPELVSLTDNTSNDFSLVVFNRAGIATDAKRATERGASLTLLRHLPLFAAARLNFSSDSPREKNCLRLFCVQRT